MGSNSSRHDAQGQDRRERSGHLPPRREAGSTSGAGADSADGLGRISESQTRGPTGRERSRGGRFRCGRFSSTRSSEASRPSPEAVAPVNITSRRSSPHKATSSNSDETLLVERPVEEQYITSWAAADATSSSTSVVAESSPPIPESTRIFESERPRAGLVMEILPAAIVSPEIVPSEISEARSARSIDTEARNNLWLEGHPPWNSRLGSSEANVQTGSSGSTGISQSSRQTLQAVCESTFQQHRQIEWQERLRRHAGFPPALDIHDWGERRGGMSAESSGTTSSRTGNASSSLSASDSDESPFRSRPASLQTWDISTEGRLIEYRRSPYSETWERHSSHLRSESQNGSTDRPSTLPGPSPASLSAAGRESRRNGGRRLWDTLTRAASHRRTSPMTPPATENASVDSWVHSDDDHLDFRSFHSRNLDLEERRRRARSQVWAWQLLSNGLEAMPGFSRPCSAGGHHHGNCSCDTSSSNEDLTTRASISRIIMLAEALFEVLDEIHRQSISLSRTSAPVVSLPAPVTVVDAIPIRKFTKVLWEESSQCNICLVEYEEGDQVRVLPCQHEYHVACVDKWLKDFHRVCPLCRGNVCDTNTAAVHVSMSA